MANPPPLAQMQSQFNSLLDAGWGQPCSVTRLSGTTDAQGHVNGLFQTLVSGERIWIQANSGRSKIDEINLDAETTHFAYQKLSGAALRPKDRILPSGGTYAYDVMYAHVFETHRMAELKQDLRTRISQLELETGFMFLLEDGSKLLLEVA